LQPCAGYLPSTIASSDAAAYITLIRSRIRIGGALSSRANGAYAQAAPVTYWIPSWPVGFGGNLTVGQSSNNYGNFPSFDGSDARAGGFSYLRYNFPNGWFAGGEGGMPQRLTVPYRIAVPLKPVL
jgi:hypothetical protein